MPAHERRRNRLLIQLTDAELAAVERLAKGESPALYVRDLLLRRLKRRKR